MAEHRAERMTGQITVQQQGASATPTHPGQSEIENRNYRTEITGQDRHTTPPHPTYGVVSLGRGSLVIAYGTAGHKYSVIAYGMVQPLNVG